MPAYNTELSLQHLMKMVPPPTSPLEVARKPARLIFTGGKQVDFPPDYLALVDRYGSGWFWFDENGESGMIAEIHNPRASAYKGLLDKEHEFLRQYKVEEGDGYKAYDIFPASPGLLQWGSAEGRQAYFWLTEGSPSQWPIIVMWDFEFFGQYDMPLAVFLEKLVAGKLDARFLRDERVPMKLEPSRVSFVAHATRSR